MPCPAHTLHSDNSDQRLASADHAPVHQRPLRLLLQTSPPELTLSLGPPEQKVFFFVACPGVSRGCCRCWNDGAVSCGWKLAGSKAYAFGARVHPHITQHGRICLTGQLSVGERGKHAQGHGGLYGTCTSVLLHWTVHRWFQRDLHENDINVFFRVCFAAKHTYSLKTFWSVFDRCRPFSGQHCCFAAFSESRGRLTDWNRLQSDCSNSEHKHQ